MKAIPAVGLAIIVAVLAVIATLSQPSQAQPLKFQEGKHYLLVNKPSKQANPDKIEVNEVFWYGCPHCNQFRPGFAQWSEQQPDYVSVKHTPAMWSKHMVTHAKIFYTAKALKLQKKMHKEIFDAMHQKRQKLTNPNQIFLLFEKHGIDRATFDKTFDSFGIKSQVQQANARARNYGITGTPELVVNGKYRVSGRTAGSQAKMMEVVEFLIEKERAAKES